MVVALDIIVKVALTHTHLNLLYHIQKQVLLLLLFFTFVLLLSVLPLPQFFSLKSSLAGYDLELLQSHYELGQTYSDALSHVFPGFDGKVKSLHRMGVIIETHRAFDCVCVGNLKLSQSHCSCR
jgi:hypothetical protein